MLKNNNAAQKEIKDFSLASHFLAFSLLSLCITEGTACHLVSMH